MTDYEPQQSSYDLVIRGALVFDGTGAEPMFADVAIDGVRIAAVKAGISAKGSREVSGLGLCLAPGFIDVHTHDDWAVFMNPDMGFKTLQGVTTVVVGNCGTSAAPGDPARVDHTVLGLAKRQSMASYLSSLDERPASVNVAPLVGHGSIRAAVMGMKNTSQATKSEMAEMRAILEEAIEAGAFGLSTGLAYEPGRYSPIEEIVELSTLMAEVGGLYTTHMRDESDDLLASIAEAIQVGELANISVQISHLKATSRPNWGKVREALSMINQANDRGLDIMADQYPYTRGSTLLEQVVSAGAFDGPSPLGHVSPEQVLVAAAPDRPDWEGKTVAEIASQEGVDSRTMATTMVATLGRNCIVILDTMDENDVRTVMTHPRVLFGSDGIPAGDKPHPRLHHTFPRILGNYVRHQALMPLTDAIHRMTGLSARRFGLTDRGVIRPGAFADLVLFDAATIADTGTYTNPTTVPAGISGVWVNGGSVAEGGTITGNHPGMALRRAT